MTKAKTVDPMEYALSLAEATQSDAIHDAEKRVRAAVDALKPFEIHEGRVMPGVGAAVRDVRKVLDEAAASLAKIVTLHLSGPEQKADATPIEQRTDEAHMALVRESKKEEAA